MQLELAQSFNRRLITPHIIDGRTYYLLFHKNKVPGPFTIADAPISQTNSLISIGDMKTPDGQVVGNIFYTQANVICTGGFLLAYSGIFKAALNKRLPSDLEKLASVFDMPLMVKTEFMHVFSQKNKAVLVVSPMLKSTIKQNLEI